MGSQISPNLNAVRGDAGIRMVSTLLVRAVVILRDERAGLLGGVVVLVVHARAQQVSAEHLAALGLGAKAVGARKRTLVGQVGAALFLIAIANAVEAGKVGERLGRADDVVCGDGGIEVRQVDLDQLGTLGLQLLGSALDSGCLTSGVRPSASIKAG